jgi:phenylalanyl-tRNA synthetase beta chain
MKVSLNWIREYVELPADLTMEQLSYDLTMRTVEVEGAENPADSLKKVVIGKLLEVNPHPNADMLRVCLVDIGSGEPSTIVCGGSNLKAGQLVVVAVPGSFVRWHGQGDPVEIKSTKLRGVKSDGMICASGELGLEGLFPAAEEKEIMDLTAWDAKPGDLVSDVLQLDDFILEIDNKSMTNRPDLWGHYGIARELAAIYGRELKPLPAFNAPAGVPGFPVDIREQDLCRRYAAMVYDGLKVETSPYWLQLRIWEVGMRPINNLVDITNYIMLATGQPTHGFDKSCVAGGIVVRKADESEKLELLDGRVLDLTANDLLICNAREPMALAGVMGGKRDSILPETSQMVLELANFEPLSVRRTTQRFGIRTEASSRFEKGVDTQRVDQAMGLADQLIKKVLPQAQVVAFYDSYPVKTEPSVIEVPAAFLNERLGRSLSPEEVAESLKPLGFATTYSEGVFRAEAPSWRSTGDVSLPDDILEETARMIGYENFSFAPPTVALEAAINQRGVDTDRAVREYLAYRCGLQEIFTYPWIDEKYIKAAGVGLEDCFVMSTPPSPETSHIRSSLIPGILESIVTNVRYYEAFSCFELAQVFRRGETHPSEQAETLPLQERNLAAAFVGSDPATLFREAKGVLEAMPRLTRIGEFSFAQQVKPSWADKKVWLNITAGGAVIGSLGLLSPKAIRMAGIKRVQAALIELNMDKLQPLPSRQNKFEHLPLFPLVEQDFSVLIDEKVKWLDIEQLVSNMVRRCKFIEEYRGKQIPEGKKSVMFRVWIGSDEKTLTAEEIEQKTNSIIKRISKELGGEIRSS